MILWTLNVGLGATGPHPGDETIRRRLDDILARPEFRPAERGTAALFSFITDFFRWLGNLGDTSPGLFWLMLLVCVALLVVLLGHIGWTVKRVFFTDARLAQHTDADARRVRQSQDYWQEGQRLAAALDFTEAIRFLFLSVVYRFDESGRVDFPYAFTNREYLALFADRPVLHDSLKTFVDLLDDCWYGLRPAERRQYEACLALYNTLIAG
jgi:hypothetical protein